MHIRVQIYVIVCNIIHNTQKGGVGIKGILPRPGYEKITNG